MASPRASILAIGTELTTGQITNRNAAWISDRLSLLGIEVVLHETVADDRARMRRALEHCASEADLLFVTGGLGPTTDDFTRDVVAEWAGKPLVFDDPSWQRIVSRLGALGVRVAESNRQQCYFPEGGRIIENPQGTASAFRVDREPTRVWVLPGPPREVEAVWREIEEQLHREVPGLSPTRLLTWQCLGKSEAELGEITERALAGSGLQTGYRAHRPYVEIKVWCPPEQLDSKAQWLARLEQEIAPYVITKQGEDQAEHLWRRLARRPGTIRIVDEATGGVLAERLRRPGRAAELVTRWETGASDAVTRARELLSEGADLAVTSWAIGARLGGELRAEAVEIPYRITSRDPILVATYEERTRRFVAEIALKRWLGWLAQD